MTPEPMTWHELARREPPAGVPLVVCSALPGRPVVYAVTRYRPRSGPCPPGFFDDGRFAPFAPTHWAVLVPPPGFAPDPGPRPDAVVVERKPE